jgi:hypothetical protein
MATQPSPFDPLDRLEPSEDRFVIRENDPVGPAAITGWAHLRRNWLFKRYGLKPVGDAARILKSELAQCAEAEEKALAWGERQSGQEAPDEQRATYAGAALTEEQVALAKRQKHRAELLSHLHEAAYHATEMLEADGPAASAELLEQRDRINEIGAMIGIGERARAA